MTQPREVVPVTPFSPLHRGEGLHIDRNSPPDRDRQRFLHIQVWNRQMLRVPCIHATP